MVALSILMVAGQRRERAQRVLDAVGGQTRTAELEVVVVDLASDMPPALRPPAGVPTRIVALPATTSWGAARDRAFRESSAPVVAYIEDHCYPSAGWAEALLDAHREPWDAVGYAFTNPNRESWVSRVSMMYDYGLWAHPARDGPARLLAYNNVSYKREALLGLGERLGACLATDFHVHQELRRRGRTLAVAARALAAHENFTDLADLMQANHYYCRALAAGRVEVNGWGWARRVFYGLATPFGAPLVSLYRRLRSLRGRSTLWGPFLAALPGILVVSTWTAVGEALGYLLGAGASSRLMSHWEIDARRDRAS